MKISDFYTNQTIVEGFGRGRTRKVIAELREVWPDFLGEKKEVIEKGGRSPYFYKDVNEFYAAWLLFILSNCKSHNREDVVRAVYRGTELKNNDGEHFIIWFGNLLASPERIRRDIRSIYIFYDEDNMVSVFTEVGSDYKGANLLFHGKRPAFKIRRSAVLEKDFLVEVAELLQPIEPEKWDTENPVNKDTAEPSDEDVLREFEAELKAANSPQERAIWEKAIADHKKGMALKNKK